MKLVKQKEVTKVMDESEQKGNAETERRKSELVKRSAERFFWLLSETNMLMSKQK